MNLTQTHTQNLKLNSEGSDAMQHFRYYHSYFRDEEEDDQKVQITGSGQVT